MLSMQLMEHSSTVRTKHSTHTATEYISDPRTRRALHAPLSKDWQDSIPYPFINTLTTGDPSTFDDITYEHVH